MYRYCGNDPVNGRDPFGLETNALPRPRLPDATITVRKGGRFDSFGLSRGLNGGWSMLNGHYGSKGLGSPSISSGTGIPWRPPYQDTGAFNEGIVRSISADLFEAGILRGYYNDTILLSSTNIAREQVKAAYRTMTPPLPNAIIVAARGHNLGPPPGSPGNPTKASAFWNSIGRGFKYGGGGMLAVTVGLDAYRIGTSSNPMRESFAVSGGIAGTFALAPVGAVVGARGGLIGAAGGSALMGGIGSILGENAGYNSYDSIYGD